MPTGDSFALQVLTLDCGDCRNAVPQRNGFVTRSRSSR